MGVEPEDQPRKIVKIKRINPRSETQAQVVSSIEDEEREVEALIMPVSDEVTDSGSQQQSAHQLAIVAGPHEPERVRETEVRRSLHIGCLVNIGIILTSCFMARPREISMPI